MFVIDFEEEDEDVSDQFKTKNEEQFEWMCKAVARVALFDTFDEDQIVACVDSMYRLDFDKKDKIIEQGEQIGLHCILFGTCVIFKENKGRSFTSLNEVKPML